MSVINVDGKKEVSQNNNIILNIFNTKIKQVLMYIL